MVTVQGYMFLPITILLAVMAILFSKFIKKHSRIIYILSFAISVVSFFIDIKIINKGFLPLAFFTLIMFIGVLPKRNKYTKKLWQTRAELSIIGSIFLLSHVVLFFPFIYKLDPFKNGFTIALYLLGITAFLIIIPLFITSFKSIRKKMKAKSWKNLQRLAYVVYFLTFAHLTIVAIFRNKSYAWVYVATFAVYSVLRILKYLKNNSLHK
jgi:DMSO/TMAO reductase YedYZ heme-binding membrane subunit